MTETKGHGTEGVGHRLEAFPATRSYEFTDDLVSIRENAFPKEQRVPEGIIGLLVTIACVVLALFTIQMAFRVTYGPIITRAAHLIFAIPLIFLLYPAAARWRGRSIPWFDYVLAALSTAAFGWAIFSAERYELRMAYSDPREPLDIVFGVIAILVVFEATRRTVGSVIVFLTMFFIAYALTGPFWPGIFEHRGLSFEVMVEHLYMLPEGLFNFIMGIMATFLFTFLTFGAFLRVSGGDRVFTDLALAVSGHRRGGPAKVAVVSSALMGTLSGSTVSNVVTTGALTIPLMKRTGFRSYEAAAIESVASLGGALMPPMMGAGIFIMAAFTGVPLKTILGYSILPAVLYYVALYFYVDIKAGKKGLQGMPRELLPKFKDIVLQGGHIFLPVLILIWLLIEDYTPFFASSACVVAVFVVSWFRKFSRLTPRKLLIALEASTRVAITVSALSAAAAIIYGVMTATGLLVKVTSVILTVSGGVWLIAILVLAGMSYILGMGLPVTASYVLVAVLGAPALAEMGVPILTAHLLLFWFSQYATITPPICMTAFVAARVADAPPMKTGWTAVLMGKALYVMPFMFVYGSLLTQSLVEILFDFCVLFASLALMPMAIEGYAIDKTSTAERLLTAIASVLFLIAALGVVQQGWLYAVLGLVTMAVSTGLARRRRRSKASDALAAPYEQ